MQRLPLQTSKPRGYTAPDACADASSTSVIGKRRIAHGRGGAVCVGWLAGRARASRGLQSLHTRHASGWGHITRPQRSTTITQQGSCAHWAGRRGGDILRIYPGMQVATQGVPQGCGRARCTLLWSHAVWTTQEPHPPACRVGTQSGSARRGMAGAGEREVTPACGETLRPRCAAPRPHPAPQRPPTCSACSSAKSGMRSFNRPSLPTRHSSRLHTTASRATAA